MTTLFVPDRVATVTDAGLLRGYLRRTSDGAWLAARAISFSVDGTPVGAASTDAKGRATLVWTVTEGPPTRTITAEFSGDAAYCASTDSAMLTALTFNTKMSGFDRAARITDRTELKARLVRSDNVPLYGKGISFYVDGTFVATRNTDVDGYARWPVYDVPDGSGAGSRSIYAEWAGDGGYRASSVSSTLYVGKAIPYIWVLPKSIPHGDLANLYAYFRRLYDSQKQEAKLVTFLLDGTRIADVTTGTGANAGVARCLYRTVEPVGEHVIVCDFAGDAWLDAGYG